MSATKKPLTLAKLAATVEKMRATCAKELKEIRDKALKNKQGCAEMMAHSRKLATAADREAQKLEEMLKKIAGMAQELQRTFTTTQPPAKKTKA
jgi:hypothetical protein